jgi:hypothetical protein
MATITSVQGSRTSLLTLSTLASATYLTSNAYDCAANDPLDVIIECEVTPGNSVAGNKQIVIFAKASLNGTNFQSGPESGTTATDEPDLTFVGVVPVITNSGAQRKMFSLGQAFGFIPLQFKIVVKNDSGQAIASGTIYTAEITGASN